MTELQLFLGLPVDADMHTRLKSSKDYNRILSDYLIEIHGSNGRFIGKKLDKSVDSEQLRNAEASIYSLLTKLHPNFPFKTIPLVLFPHE